MSDGLHTFARICVNRLSQTTEARIGRALKGIFLLCCFSFSKKEKSIRFHRREAPQGVAEGDERGRVYFSCSCKKRYQKKHEKKVTLTAKGTL